MYYQGVSIWIREENVVFRGALCGEYVVCKTFVSSEEGMRGRKGESVREGVLCFRYVLFCCF